MLGFKSFDAPRVSSLVSSSSICFGKTNWRAGSNRVKLRLNRSTPWPLILQPGRLSVSLLKICDTTTRLLLMNGLVNYCPRCRSHSGASKPYWKEAGPFLENQFDILGATLTV